MVNYLNQMLVLQLLVSILFGVEVALSCFCEPRHIQTHVCTSEFVAVLRIVQKIPSSDSLYKFNIVNIFKTTGTSKIALRAGKLTTGNGTDPCRVELEVGRDYIVAGDLTGKLISLNKCQLVRPWETLSDCQRREFKLMYIENCQCKVVNEIPMFGVQVDRTTCVWNTRPENGFFEDCQGDFAVCTNYDKVGCGWLGDMSLQMCLDREKKRPNVPPRRKVLHKKIHEKPFF